MDMTASPHEERKERMFPCHGNMGPFQSPQHTFAILLGLAGIVCFSFALVQQRPFDATLAAVAVILCWYIYFLHTERGKLHARQPDSLSQDSVTHATEHITSLESDGMCELDLTGYAKTLGVSLGSGTGLEEGGTLSKILLDALAKEYLRCMSALKCYQQAFGALPEDIETNQATRVRTEPSPSVPMLLPLELVASTEPSAAPTPRSPMANPPSPDPRRSRLQTEAQSSTSQSHATRNVLARPEGASETEGADEGYGRTSCPSSLATSSGEARTSTEEPMPQSPMPQSYPDYSRETREETPPCSFGLFGRY